MADEYSSWTDQERMLAYRACCIGVQAENNKPGEAALVALAKGDISGYILAWVNMIRHEYDSTGPCERFLTPDQKTAVHLAIQQDRENKRDDVGRGGPSIKN